MNEITRLLNAEGSGVDDRLLAVVYDELRQLAAAKMANERPGQTLAATGLVHEAWLRLVGVDSSWESRAHFFGAAAEAMRRILIERARRKKSVKHGGQFQRAELDLAAIETAEPDQRLLKLDDALNRFAEVEPQKAELVKLRFFAGCSIKDAARILGLSTATADRHWAYARAWLQTEMQSADPE